MMVHFNEFANSSELDNQLAQNIIDKLTKAISQEGYASMVISGGRTPAGLFKILSHHPLAWDKVYITLADERWVNTDDNASNEKSVRENLLQGYAEKAKFVGLKTAAKEPFSGAKETEKLIEKMPRPFDLVILGMGEDGHTASLFPGAIALPDALFPKKGELCLGITPLTAPHDRITLTRPTLLNSKAIYLHIVGDNKKTVYDKAISGQDINEMPIRAFLQQEKVPVSVFWSP